jgi:thymidine phosphorylase
VIALGGGRKFVGQAIDPTVGLEMLVRVGETVERSQPIVQVFSSEHSDREAAIAWLDQSFRIGDTPPASVPLFQPL